MNQRKWILILSVLCAVSLAVMTAALLFRSGTGVFVPPPFDASAQTGNPEVPDGMGYRELEVRSFRVSLCAEPVTEDETAVVYLTNPAENEVWLKLRILDEQGNLLGESGLVRPGEYIRQVPLQTVPEPGACTVLKVMAYEPDTYHSQGSLVLNTRMGNRTCISSEHPV